MVPVVRFVRSVIEWLNNEGFNRALALHREAKAVTCLRTPKITPARILRWLAFHRALARLCGCGSQTRVPRHSFHPTNPKYSTLSFGFCPAVTTPCHFCQFQRAWPRTTFANDGSRKGHLRLTK